MSDPQRSIMILVRVLHLPRLSTENSPVSAAMGGQIFGGSHAADVAVTRLGGSSAISFLVLLVALCLVCRKFCEKIFLYFLGIGDFCIAVVQEF